LALIVLGIGLTLLARRSRRISDQMLASEEL